MSIAAAHSAAFYREVALAQCVWAIEDAGGFPAPIANGTKRAMPFWSSESRANKIVENVTAYKGFKPVPIPWSTFCERWIPGLTHDGYLAGINWSGSSATGFDVEPEQVRRNVESVLNASV